MNTKVILEFTGPINRGKLPQKSTYEVKEGFTLENLLTKLGLSKDQLKYITPFVNGEKKLLKYKLRQNDFIRLFMPIGGG